MKILKMTSRFKKDLKRIQNNPKRIANVETVLRLLRDTGTVPQQYHPHMLTGNYAGCMECHIESDYPLYTSVYSPAASKHGQSLRMYGLSWQWPRMRACG